MAYITKFKEKVTPFFLLMADRVPRIIIFTRHFQELQIFVRLFIMIKLEAVFLKDAKNIL